MPTKNVIGIDIGSSAIKMASIVWLKGQPLLKNSSVIELPKKVMDNGYIADKDAMSAVLCQLISTSGISGQNVVVAVGGRTTFAREVILPAMNVEELREALKWDLEKYVPLAPDEYYFDFALLRTGKTDLKVKVLLVAAPKKIVNSITDLIKQVGLNPVAVDIEPLALARTIAVVDHSVVVDIGAAVSQVTIFQQDSPSVTRLIPFGGQRFTEVIMQVLDLDFGEAERFKQRQKGLLQRSDFPDAQSELHCQLGEVVAELAREVRRTIEYYQLQNKDAVIANIVLTGGGAMLDNLAPHLSTQLEMTVTLHKPLARIAVASSFDQHYLDKMSLRLAVAIGLGLRGGKRYYDSD
jgi:type IV pilus assembly protein PilM